MQQIQGSPTFVFCGGIQLSLNLTRAFDCVWRSLLSDHMAAMGLSSVLLTLTSQWHVGTHYNWQYHSNTCWGWPSARMQNSTNAKYIWSIGLYSYVVSHTHTHFLISSWNDAPDEELVFKGSDTTSQYNLSMDWDTLHPDFQDFPMTWIDPGGWSPSLAVRQRRAREPSDSPATGATEP